jgi:hypothetical protein
MPASTGHEGLGGKAAITEVVDEFVARVAADKPAGAGITAAPFHALVKDLVGALDKFKIAPEGKRKMPGILGPMEKVIAEKERSRW